MSPPDEPNDLPFPANPAPPTLLSDDKIARLLATPEQPPPTYDARFDALNRRRARALSDDEIVAILAAPAMTRPTELPTASVSTTPVPAVLLDYRTAATHRRPHTARELADAINTLPLPLRVARVAVWLVLAALILLLFLDPPGGT